MNGPVGPFTRSTTAPKKDWGAQSLTRQVLHHPDLEIFGVVGEVKIPKDLIILFVKKASSNCGEGIALPDGRFVNEAEFLTIVIDDFAADDVDKASRRTNQTDEDKYVLRLIDYDVCIAVRGAVTIRNLEALIFSFVQIPIELSDLAASPVALEKDSVAVVRTCLIIA